MFKIPSNPLIDYNLSRKIYNSILIFSILWLVLIILAPLLLSLGNGYSDIASFIYIFFSKLCHQYDDRSFHLFGYKLAVCSRCLAIYTGFLAGTLLYSILKKPDNMTPPSIWYLVGGVIILTIDILLDMTGVWLNTFISRSVTGLIVGFILPFYIIPGFMKFFYEVHSFLRNKYST